MGARQMKALFVFLIGLTAGVGLLRIIDGASATQARLLAMFFSGVLLGMIATSMCIGGWSSE